MTTITLRGVPTGELRPGDVVLAHGMRVRIDRVVPYHPGGRGCVTGPGAATLTQCDLAWSCSGTVTNLAEVRATGIIPRSFLYDSVRDRLGPGHGREDFWNVQGNNLATWTAERAS
jgi:hypothetical protein